MKTKLVALSLVAAALVLAGCSNKPGGPQAEKCMYVQAADYGPDGEVAVRAEKVADGLEVPWGIGFVDAETFFVTERAGRLRLVEEGELVDEPVLDLTDRVGGGEGGLLDVLLHPEFDENGVFYLYYTDNSGDTSRNRVEQWRWDGKARTASPESVIVDDIPAASYHDGGRMRIGPDGLLYIGTGDAGTPDNAQDATSPAGKILRVNLDGSVPEDNPFGDDNPAYAMGVRNAQGLAWFEDGTMAMTDHGPSGEFGRSDHDEVNLVEAGANLGWPDIYACQAGEGQEAPRVTWANAVPPGGAAVYTGDAIEAWEGDLFVGALRAQHLHRLEIDTNRRVVTSREVYFRGAPSEGLGRVRDVTMGPDGHMYVTTSNCDGRGQCPDEGDGVYRIVPE